MIGKTLGVLLAIFRLVIERFNLIEATNLIYYKLQGAKIGQGSRIKHRVIIYDCPQTEIGYGTVIGDYVHIWAGGGLKIGDNVLIAAHTVISTDAHDPDAVMKGKTYNQTTVRKPISIANNVWIGGNCVILPGVTIGENAIIGAGSVVTCDVPAGEIWYGNPARCSRKIAEKG